MAGFFILDDGRAFAPNNWAYRATLQAIIDTLPSTPEGKALAEWLEADDVVQIYHSVDFRELTTANKDLVYAAVQNAFKLESERGPVGWVHPENFPSWMEGMADFVKMIECVRRGEPPADFNPYLRDVIPPTGEQKGPGW